MPPETIATRPAGDGVALESVARPRRSATLTPVAECGDAPCTRTASFWRALVADPTHANELAVLYLLPQLAGHVGRWHRARTRRHPDEPADRRAWRVLHRSARVGRRGGAIVGSSFYVAMPPALAVVYCEQLLVILKIAAAYGRDPWQPERAAEVLVIQGRYQSVEDASHALQLAGTPARPSDGGEARRARLAAIFGALGQVPSMIGLRVRKIRAAHPFDIVVMIVEVASYVVPVLSVPVWALANARATRRLGHAAVDFYERRAAPGESAPDVPLFPPVTAAMRRRSIAVVVALALGLGALAVVEPVGRIHHGVGVAVLVVAEAILVLTFGRLLRLTRLDRSRGPGSK